MIIRSSSTFFGGKTTVIRTSSFTCTVSTKRDGLFSPLATLIVKGDEGAAGDDAHVCGRISYFPEMGKDDILDLHSTIAQAMDEDGEKGFPLGVALQGVIEFLTDEGLASETINAVPWDGV